MAKKIAVHLLEKFAPLYGFTCWVEPEYGFIGYLEKEGKKYFFRNTAIDLNDAGAERITRDKGYTSILLEKFGFSVVEGKTFLSEGFSALIGKDLGPEEGLRYAESLGFPVIIKPNNMAQGKGVYKIINAEEYKKTIGDLLAITERYRIERYTSGRDYRVLVIDDEVLACYERIPLSIIGDGVRTIESLLEEKSEIQKVNGRGNPLSKDDPRMLSILMRECLSLKSVLEKDRSLQLLDNANLSSGGDIIDYSDMIHPTFREISVRATREFGLRLCGVDIITGDITLPISETNPYIILELNAAPGLSHYTTLSEEANSRTETIYKKVLEKLAYRAV